jgi:hypothetical protein
MADQFDPDAYLASKAGGGPAVAEPPAFDPDAYLRSKIAPESGATSLAQIGRNALDAAKELGQGMLREAADPQEAVKRALFFPAMAEMLPKQIGGIVDTVRGVQEAGKTPDWSKERFKAGFNVVSQLAPFLFGARGPEVADIGAETAAGRPTLTETLFPGEAASTTTAPVIPEIKPEEVIQHAEPIIEAAQTNGLRTEPQVPEETQKPTADEGSQGVPEGGQGAEVQAVAAPAAPTPQLLPGETQGDLISSTQPEDIKLVGEQGTDFSARQTEAEAAAQRAEEARLLVEHQQGLLSDFQEHQAQGGDELLSALRDAGGLPAVYAADHPLAGELNALREEFSKSSKYTQQKFAKAGEVNFGDVFSAKGRQDIDQLTRDLRAKGFDVQTPGDLISLVQDRLRSGKPVYGDEARGAALEHASFGGVGIVPHPLPGFFRSAVDYFTNNKPSQIWNTIKGSIDASLGKTFPKTTIADRTAGEAGARWISAKVAAPHLADTFATNVLEGTGIDPVKFGAALTEDNLRSIKAVAETPEAKAAVSTIIGSKGSPFKTEAEYKAFISDPATQQAIERHKELWTQSVDPMYRKAQLLDPSEPLPSRGEDTGARINLYNDVEGTGKDVVSGTGKGNLTATFRRKSPFAIQAKGTGQSYNINYNEIMANTFGRQLEVAAKNDFETKLVDSGNAVIGKPGENPVLPDGEKTVAFPLKRTTIITAEDGSKIPVNQNLYVRKSLATEYRNAANVDRYDVPGVVKAFANAANKSALAGLTDASVHGLNLMTALFTRPSIVGGALSDSLLSTFGRADVPVTIAKVLKKAFGDNKEQIASLSEIGAMKPERATINPLAKFIQVADKSTRLVLDDTFKKMADAGLVENTETNRREFVNQVGQYSIRAQGGLRRLAREVGFGPFATAGTTFNTLGARTATLSPGVKATSPLAAASLRANVLSKWVGASVLVGTLNYLLTKDKGGGVGGRPGVPVGRVDTGLDDQNGRPLSFPVFDLLGLGRALRVTGARGLIESQRKGLNLQTALDASARDVANSAIAPFAGPVVRFGTVATTGFQPAINVPRTGHVAPPGQNQFEQNIKDAILDANPVVKSFALANEPGGNAADAVRQQIPRLSLVPSQRPEFIEKYPEIVHKAQASAFIDDVIRRARNMQPEARSKFVNDSLDKLTDEDRAHAVKTLRYRKIEY